MADFTTADDLRGSTFTDVSLEGSRFVRSGLVDVVMRGVDVGGADIDSPWLLEPGGALIVNGVDVVPFVDAELNHRFPGRELRRADTPATLRDAWAALEPAWEAATLRVAAMPPGTMDVSVGGEWSYAQTLRHLVMATDVWLRRAIQLVDAPYSPIGLPHSEYETDGNDMSVFSTTHPEWAEVLDVRAGRVAMVRDFLANVTADDLAAECRNPWAPDRTKTVLSCLQTILEEEWEHLRYATRDLDAIERGQAS